MLHYDEFKEAIDRGYVIGPTVGISRRNGIIYDYALPDEPLQNWEVIMQENVEDVLDELSRSKIR